MANEQRSDQDEIQDRHESCVEQASAEAFLPTLERVTRNIETAGLTIFARIDHAANAAAVGLTMPPAVVLVYGNARGGTPIMIGTPHLALDLPLRVLVREDEEHRVFVAYRPIAPLLRRTGVPAAASEKLVGAQQAIMKDIVR